MLGNLNRSVVLGGVLYEPGSLLRHIYFPTSSIVSLLYDGRWGVRQIAVIETMDWSASSSGRRTTSSRAVVQNAGSAYRIKTEAFMVEFERHGELERLLLHIPRRCSPKWFKRLRAIATMDRSAILPMAAPESRPAARRELTMTEKLMANMLGLTVAAVSVLADSFSRLDC